MFLNSPNLRVLSAGTLLLVLLACAGCRNEDPIVTYTIPTTMPAQLQAGKERMLAAMVPRGDNIWFFKITGPEAAIERVEQPFKQFVTDIEFEDDHPHWETLPDGWQKAGEKAMRYASIDITTPEKQLDLSISRLPKHGDWDEQVVANVNRWRGQVGLAPSTEKWAEGKPLQVPSSDGDSVWVDLVGEGGAAGSMMGTPPFAGGAPFAHPPIGQSSPMAEQAGQGDATAGPESSAKTTGEPPLKYKAPAGWRDGRMSMMRWAAFNVGPDDAAAELTVMPAGGDLRENVARWIGQIRPSGSTDELVDQAFADAQTIQVDGRESKRYLLLGEDTDEGTAIDATIIPLDDGMSLFVKMTGPTKTVRDASDEIADFLKSIQL